MPLSKLQFRPGINKENTNYANEGGWYDSDKIRFRSGYPEKIGGWTNITTFTSQVFKGVARSMWNWITLDGANLLGLGTNQKYYVENGGAYFDITPLRATVTINTDPFATTNGSKLVVVTDTAHGASVGSFVTFSGATGTDIGGIPIAQFNTEHEIVAVIDANTYWIICTSAATSSTSGGGAAVSAAYQLNAGNAIYTAGAGWGAGGWGRGGWGSGTTIGIDNQLFFWTHDNYGENLLMAPRGGKIYLWEPDPPVYTRAITLSSASTTAGYDGTFVPHTTYEVIASGAQRFVIAIGANSYDPLDANTAFDPMLVRWSDQENLYEWKQEVTNQAGEQRLNHGSMLMGAQITRDEILVWSDSALYSMQYLGPPYVWGFTVLMDNISIVSPQAAITVNNVTYWMGTDKFYSYSGRVDTLPCTVRQYVFDNMNKDQQWQTVCGVNAAFSEVWWFYPSVDSLVVDSYVVYNYLDNAWYIGTLERSSWLDSGLRNYPMATFSVQNSYLSTAVNSSIDTLSLLDASSYPDSGVVTIDSEEISYTGKSGNTLTGCTRGYNSTTAASHVAYSTVTFSTPNQVLYHEFGVDDLATSTPRAIEAYIQSSDFDIGDGMNFGFVWRMLPDVSFNGSTANSPRINIVVKPRLNSGSAYGNPNAPAVTRTATYPVEQFTGQVYTRIRGRQMAFRVESTDTGVTWQLGTPRIDIRPDGRR